MIVRSGLPSAEFNYVRDLVHEQSGLTLEMGKEYLVESRLVPLAKQHGFSSLTQMINSLRFVPPGDFHRKVVEALTTNETSFFRDARAFEMIAKSILPALVEQRSAPRTLNIWCAGCSSGQEPYSLAMLVREHRSLLDGWKVTIIASDISREMLQRGIAGSYSQLEINRGLPAGMLVKYFRQRGPMWEICREIREMVDFREINLIRAWPNLPPMQLVLMRNVLIYLDPERKKEIFARTARQLDARGYLMLGGAETTITADDSFEPVSLSGTVCFRQRKAPIARGCASRPRIVRSMSSISTGTNADRFS